MGIIPLQFLSGQTADKLQLTGKEKYTIKLSQELIPGQLVDVEVYIGNEVDVS